MFCSGITPRSIWRAPVGCRRRHEGIADRFREAFDDIERVDSLVDGFPFGVFKGKIPGILRIRMKVIRDTAAVARYSHVNERFTKELSICIGHIVMLFFPQEPFLASPNVRNDRIQVVIRVPE